MTTLIAVVHLVIAIQGQMSNFSTNLTIWMLRLISSIARIRGRVVVLVLKTNSAIVRIATSTSTSAITVTTSASVKGVIELRRTLT